MEVIKERKISCYIDGKDNEQANRMKYAKITRTQSKSRICSVNNTMAVLLGSENINSAKAFAVYNYIMFDIYLIYILLFRDRNTNECN